MDTKAEQTDHPDIHQTEEQGGLVTEHSVNITSNWHSIQWQGDGESNTKIAVVSQTLTI